MPDQTAYTAAQIVSVANAARQSAGLNPLHPNDLLTQAANAKVQAMIKANSWSHNTPDHTAWQFLDAANYNYSIAGENLARNFDSPAAVIEAWLNSPSHRNNLLNPQYTETGVAVMMNPDTNSLLVVQYLADPITTVEATVKPAFNPTVMVEFSPPPTRFLWLILPLVLVIIFLFFRHKRPHPPPPIKHWRR